jgi:hypothetical protein
VIHYTARIERIADQRDQPKVAAASMDMRAVKLGGNTSSRHDCGCLGLHYETLAICRSRLGSRRIRGCDRREARRPVHDPQSHARGEAAPGGRLVRFGRRPGGATRGGRSVVLT